ncbi:methyltransferase family protein [Actinoallomurus bryophytorum]|uniref:Methyltransferase family protein n=1 Tax=Actinoallomurus bryophytorum TaxID=1490222 RepID=A0A543CG88_9ACTN|nr:class I SAM-dependent methyltransferase [Actinoallomurus bryophytorum]TQL96111.1 methyltransferase family protein [Actinoallomurus bryophytorum]
MQGETRAHYDRLADTYDENWAYSPEFIRWMTKCIVDRLSVDTDDRVADIGCGTGLYARGLAERAGRVACVDPSAKMLEQLPAGDAYFPVQASAEQIASGDVRLPYDRLDVILVKEAIHHVDDRQGVLHGLAGLLADGGRLLVVMLPVSIEYPLFADALALFEQVQPDPEDVAAAMRRHGLRTELTYESFPLSFTKTKYLAMVRSRYMSLLSNFTDEQIERGIEQIDQRHEEERLSFPDRFAFVLGTRV